MSTMLIKRQSHQHNLFLILITPRLKPTCSAYDSLHPANCHHSLSGRIHADMSTRPSTSMSDCVILATSYRYMSQSSATLPVTALCLRSIQPLW